MLTLEERVSKNRLLRLIGRRIRFGFIREQTTHPYCPDNGRPALTSVMPFVGRPFGIRSERRPRTSEIAVNAAYRWFFGLPLTGEVPDISAPSQNRHRSVGGINPGRPFRMACPMDGCSTAAAR